jgi:hypothetical protein
VGNLVPSGESAFEVFERWHAHHELVSAVTEPDTLPLIVATPADTPAPEAEAVVEELAPRARGRRVAGVLALLSLAATAAAAYRTWPHPTTHTLGVAGLLALMTIVLAMLRSGAPVTRVTVRAGRLDIVRGESRYCFDLTDDQTRIDVVGNPGERRWRVLFHRRSLTPYVVDKAMVDPVEFTRILRRHRPSED